MICELCGADVPHTKNVAIESTVLSVCSNCAKFGDEVTTPVVRRGSMPPVIAQRLEARMRRQTPRDVYTETGEMELADDFPQRIRRAREDRGWKQADLGAKINEKVSVISQLESGAISPGEPLYVMLYAAAIVFFAFFYNAVGVPVAAGALYPFFGILLNPIFAAAAMGMSSVTVVSSNRCR